MLPLRNDVWIDVDALESLVEQGDGSTDYRSQADALMSMIAGIQMLLQHSIPLPRIISTHCPRSDHQLQISHSALPRNAIKQRISPARGFRVSTSSNEILQVVATVCW